MSAISLLLFVAFGPVRAAAQENWTHGVPLEAYKPNYFLMGQPETKIQGSLKVRLIQDQNLYFGYTQLMMWQMVRRDPYIFDIKGYSQIQVEDLLKHARDAGISELMVPRKIKQVASLPLLGSGKTDYAAIQKLVIIA